MKTTLAIAAMFLSAAYLTPAAHATGIPFTATTTLPATGSTYTSVTMSLNDGAGSITAYGYSGVFSTTVPPASVNVNSPAKSVDLDVSSAGLGLAAGGGDAPYIGPEDAVLLDFANVKSTATSGGQTGSVTEVTFDLDIEGAGSSDWVVYGMSNATGTGTGTVLDSGPMSPTGTFTVPIPTSSLYQSYLIGVTQDCSLTIDSVNIQYTPTTTTQTPEPGTFVMGGMALIALGITMKRRNRKA
jgi:hypothetical protein